MSLSTLRNLEVIGKLPKHNRGSRLSTHSGAGLIRLNEGIVKKAIYNHCSKTLADEAINGFRRPELDDTIGEEDFLKTDQPYHPVKRDLHYRKALRITAKLFKPSRVLKPIAYPDLRYYPWTLNVSAEQPYTSQPKWKEYIRRRQADGEDIDGRLTFHNLYDEIFHINRKHVHNIKYKQRPFWTMDGEPVPYKWTSLHSRIHLTRKDKDDKIRAVFGVPKLLLQVENMFIWNLQKEYLNEKVFSPMLWGFETSKGGWNKLWNRLSGKNFNSVLSSDWSGFDHRALHEVIDDIHEMWRSWFDFDNGYEPSISDTHDYSDSKTDPEKIQNLWDWMTHAVKHTPIAGPSHTLYRWRFNGIASGFQQTQLLDSFVNSVYILTCLSAVGINIESQDFQMFVQGDDNLAVFPEWDLATQGQDFLNRLSKQALDRFNAVLSVDKTTWGSTLNDVEVLSYRNRNGISYRDEAELLAKLLYPERPRTLAATASAAVGIALAAMGSSRTVHTVCKDVFDFITKEFKIEPRPDENIKKYSHITQSTLNEVGNNQGRFPSIEKCYSQNFDYSGRTEREKQRLWPTKPTGNGFRFLFN